MKSTIIDLTGQRFGMLTVVSRSNNVNGSAMWLCACECGEGAIVRGASLRAGARTTCGNHRSEAHLAAPRRGGTKTHGMDGTPEYRAWINMRSRCNNPTHAAYKDYGARGIKICPEWENSFERFYADMGPRPSVAHSIEREDVDRGYEPDNCHWATNLEQHRNTRRTRYVEIDGVVSTLAEAAAQMGISKSALSHRIERGRPGMKFVPRQKPTPVFRASPFHTHLLMPTL